jgi:hypothetical protein
MDEWTAATQGVTTATRWMIGQDRDRANHYVEVVEFSSYDGPRDGESHAEEDSDS